MGKLPNNWATQTMNDCESHEQRYSVHFQRCLERGTMYLTIRKIESYLNYYNGTIGCVKGNFSHGCKGTWVNILEAVTGPKTFTKLVICKNIMWFTFVSKEQMVKTRNIAQNPSKFFRKEGLVRTIVGFVPRQLMCTSVEWVLPQCFGWILA